MTIGNYTISVTGLSSAGDVVAGTTIIITAKDPNAKNASTRGPLLAISQVSLIDTTSNSVIYTS